MVTYGPWIDAPIYTEIFTVSQHPEYPEMWGLTREVTPTPMYNGVPYAVPNGAAGWTTDRWGTASGGAGRSVNDLNHPTEYGDPDISKFTWFDALNDTAGINGGPGYGINKPQVDYKGVINEPGNFGVLWHREAWVHRAFEMGSKFVVFNSDVNWSALQAIPRDYPAGVSYVETDPARSTPALLGKILSLRLDFNLFGGQFVLYALGIQAGVGDREFRVPQLGYGLDGYQTAADGNRTGTKLGASGTFSFDVDPLDAWKADIGFGESTFVHPSRLPTIGVNWDTSVGEQGWPGDKFGPDKVYQGEGTITWTMKWQPTRWRYVYDEVQLGRLKVPVEGGWKFANPYPGENNNLGRLKVRTGTGWQSAEALKVKTNEGWKPA